MINYPTRTATSPKYAENNYYDIKIKVSDLRAAAKKAGITVRKIARGIHHNIIQVATVRR
jgi:hypothetical protein